MRAGGGEVHPVVGQGELADDEMVEVLDARVVEAHVVCGPAGAERVALCCKLADEVGEVAVVGVTARDPAQDRDTLAGDAFRPAEEAATAVNRTCPRCSGTSAPIKNV